ncbi:MAG TPA: FHA domain-containing protein [Mycobacteriales bacterium]|nr:FHA domain-containing protein [Mycobacteriales bacterium]
MSDSVAATPAAHPVLVVEQAGSGDPQQIPLTAEVTTVGRGPGVDVRLADPTVSRLHAELVRRGPYVYVADAGLSRNGTSLNGRPVGRAVVGPRDVLAFGAVRARIAGVPDGTTADDTRQFGVGEIAPDLTRRERDVLEALCRPVLSRTAFVVPASTRDVARELVVTEAAVKQHLLRLYQKFDIPEGGNRRARLANEVVAIGVVQPSRDPVTTLSAQQ